MVRSNNTLTIGNSDKSRLGSKIRMERERTQLVGLFLKIFFV